MAFDRNGTTKSKNQFAARILSRKTDSMVCWAHVTDDVARRLFGVMNVAEIPYAAAAEKLPVLLDNERTYIVVTDMTASLEPVSVEEY